MRTRCASPAPTARRPPPACARTILMAAERDPTVMIGGTLPLLHAGHRVGGGDTIILESCEYHDSFLAFHPTIAVILDIEADHLDYFTDLADVEDSFRQVRGQGAAARAHSRKPRRPQHYGDACPPGARAVHLRPDRQGGRLRAQYPPRGRGQRV